jgi:NTP pyrophosphatase (non-canonical NTP hydrolase)
VPELSEAPTLRAYQTYVTELEIERGFSDQGPIDKCLLLGEEVGELFKAVRKAEGLVIDANSHVGEIGHELADVFVYLCALANRYGVDLETAFRAKEAINERRLWTRRGASAVPQP